MNKHVYEEPALELIALDAMDVLRTSDEEEDVWTPFV